MPIALVVFIVSYYCNGRVRTVKCRAVMSQATEFHNVRGRAAGRQTSLGLRAILGLIVTRGGVDNSHYYFIT